MRILRLRAGDDDGFGALEFALLTPALLLVLGTLYAAGRDVQAHDAVQGASADAARQASMQRTATGARKAATTAATASLTNSGLHCTNTSVTLNLSGYAAPVGAPATLTATVTCTITFTNLQVPYLPGSMTVTSTSRSPIDTYRGRSTT